MPQPAGEFAPWLGVFETLRVIDGVPLFPAEHLTEMRRALKALGLTSDFDVGQAQAGLPSLSGRWRWLVTPEGTRTVFTEEEVALADPVALSVATVRVGSSNWDARFKTVSYLAHVQAWKTASTPEVILLNEHGHVASAARANIFWRRGDQIFTPSHEAGCRQGVVRSFVLKRRNVKIGHFSLTDLLPTDEIFLTNSIKGIVSVNEWQGQSLKLFPQADLLRQKYEEEIAAQVARGKSQACTSEDKP